MEGLHQEHVRVVHENDLADKTFYHWTIAVRSMNGEYHH